MTETALSFELPTKFTVEKFLAKLSKKNSLELALQQHISKTFYDSFDWRLYNANLMFESNQSKTNASLALKKYTTETSIASLSVNKIPRFANELPNSLLSTKLSKLLEMRALLPLATLDLQLYRINILNKDQKTIARLNIVDYAQIKIQLTIQPIKGYDKATQRLSQQFTRDFAFSETNTSLLLTALKLQQRIPKDYTSKLKLKLEASMPTVEAVQIIYQTLLNAIKVNEHGTINNIDSEFLHDFRVAVRRTRSGLTQIKGTLPADKVLYFGEYFAWLGKITGLTRDMDVYLLSFDTYKTSLPVFMQEHLNPLKNFLEGKQKAAQKELVRHLKSKKYLTGLEEWTNYLTELPNEKLSSSPTIKELADRRIWKAYQRVLKEGSVITEKSPAESLHDLRKTCKKLRYLMEFFQSLYVPEKITSLIKVLKGFQEVLGDFQDYEVQEYALRDFSEEMMKLNIPSETFLAMGVLVQKLDEKRCEARNHFAERFYHFKTAKNQANFKSLFAGDKS